MYAVTTVIGLVWILFWVYWLVSARGAKPGSRPTRGAPVRVAGVVVVALAVRALGSTDRGVHSPALIAVGFVVFGSGLALAIWARVHLGRNWGMPMTVKDEPELVTSGPYRRVRHPIYSGLLLAVLGTALATNLVGLILLVAVGAYFVHSARVEERNLMAAFPNAYPAYRARTRMLIPFIA